ncbi:hypothetical protein RND81_14G086600 [Saponaria officinalis]|uniref:peptidylprolyl isomerase n=1 Tax=Saponaria officinalis TaxID=3572 RepID=A0AAW1GK05_SAPOF
MASMAASALLLPLAVGGSSNTHKRAQTNTQSLITRCSNTVHGPALSWAESSSSNLVKRRNAIGLFLGLSYLVVESRDAVAAGLPPEQKPKLCDDVCEKELENVPMVTTESGLQFKDIKIGNGPSPPVGFQVAANYVAMVPSGQIFDSSLEKGQFYIFRVGSGQVIKGLDEGILSMKVGGKRRLYIPGSLAFPKGLNSAPGRPRVAPSSPVIFDVSLEYIPGLETVEE